MNWLIYGANGYTGRLLAREAVRRGLQPVLAGRSTGPVAAMAKDLELDYRVARLDDPAALNAALEGMDLVLHCAGPFSATSAPMVDACLGQGVHYMDITGEISVFHAIHERKDEARRRDIVLLPGSGFDVVPTDCLAARLVQALPAATELQLAFEAAGGASPGTARTSVERLGQGGCVRRDGELRTVPMAWKTRRIAFAHAERTGVTIPWGDVYTATVSTGIPNVEVYLSLPDKTISRLKMLRRMGPLLRMHIVQSFLRGRIERTVSGPSDEVRARTQTQVWGQVSSPDGQTVSATMTTPNGYDLTVSAALGLFEYLRDNDVEGGFYTPSMLAGAGFAESLPGVSLSIGS